MRRWYDTRTQKKTKNALTCIIRGFLSLFLVSFFYRWPQFFLFSLYIFAWLLLLMFYVCVCFFLSSLLVEMNYIIILGWCCCVLLLLLEHFNNLCWFLALVRPFIILCFMRAHIDDILSLWSITMPNVFSPLLLLLLYSAFNSYLSFLSRVSGHSNFYILV